jgi:hypothetical protein
VNALTILLFLKQEVAYSLLDKPYIFVIHLTFVSKMELVPVVSNNFEFVRSHPEQDS